MSQSEKVPAKMTAHCREKQASIKGWTRKSKKWPEVSRKTNCKSYLEVFFSLQATKVSCQVTKKSGFFAILQRFWLHVLKEKRYSYVPSNSYVKVVIPTTYVRAKICFCDHTKQVLLVTLINSSFQVQILSFWALKTNILTDISDFQF